MIKSHILIEMVNRTLETRQDYYKKVIITSVGLPYVVVWCIVCCIDILWRVLSYPVVLYYVVFSIVLHCSHCL